MQSMTGENDQETDHAGKLTFKVKHEKTQINKHSQHQQWTKKHSGTKEQKSKWDKGQRK